jgi:hypothetical protein
MKLFNIDFSFNRALTKEYFILLVLFVTSLVLLIFVALFSQSLMIKWDEYVLLKEDVEEVEARIRLVDSYKLLTDEEIRLNNRTLEELVPSGDTNLSMYYILDDLALKSGLTLSNYQLSSSARAESKSSVSVSATGTPQELLDFLSQYKFITGRLLTLESIQIRRESHDTDVLNIQMVLNYYTVTIRPISKVQDTVSQRDIEFLREIRKQVKQYEENDQNE